MKKELILVLKKYLSRRLNTEHDHKCMVLDNCINGLIIKSNNSQFHHVILYMHDEKVIVKSNISGYYVYDINDPDFMDNLKSEVANMLFVNPLGSGNATTSLTSCLDYLLN